MHFMSRRARPARLLATTLFVAATAPIAMQAHAQTVASQAGNGIIPLPTGVFISPAVIPGSTQQSLNPQLPDFPNFGAGEAVRSQLSPDGTTLAVITAGYNQLEDSNGNPVDSTQYIFIYNVSAANKSQPVLSQVIEQTNAHVGLVFSPNGKTLYAAGGADDAVYAYDLAGGTWSLAAKIALGHGNKGVGINVQPNTSGLGISADGRTLVAVNNYNDSISIIDTASNTVRYEHDLRPFFANNEGQDGGVGGTFPWAVVIKGNSTAYVSSDRDREVIAVDISSATAGHLIKRIKLDGNALGMTLDRSNSTLYVAQDNADQIAIIDTSKNVVTGKIDARAPSGMLPGPSNSDSQQQFGIHRHDFIRSYPTRSLIGSGDHRGYLGHGLQTRYTGAATSAVTLSPDGNTLYAVNSGANSIAVIPLHGGDARKVEGLIPTAYEPHDLTFSADGSWIYVINGKSVTGPNPGFVHGRARIANSYQFQLERASLVSAPLPTRADLPVLTAQVAKNNLYKAQPNEAEAKVIRFLRERIKHVVYIIKENRTFDQVLGDLNNGSNGDPGLTAYGATITPNLHALANNFVTLDNFLDAGDGSIDGWSWALQGRVSDMEAITQQVNYAAANRGLSDEIDGNNRNAPVNWPSVTERDAASGVVGTTNYSRASASLPGGTINLLPGDNDHGASDSPFGRQRGYIFDAVLQAGGSVRNYGMLVNIIGSIGTSAAPTSNPFASGVIMVAPLKPALAPHTDVYFDGIDTNYPDTWRFQEWLREFQQFEANGQLPSLSLVRLGEDHMGSFGTALAGINTPETQMADNDYAVGKLIETVAHSQRYANNTLVIVIEDDSQDGPDHVDSHRSTTYVAGPYVKQGAIISTPYSLVSPLRTIEDILGTEHINLNTAFARPMSDVFDIGSSGVWTFNAVASTALQGTGLQVTLNETGAKYAEGPVVKSTHDAAYWANVTRGFDFSGADRVPPALFNKVLWEGLMGDKPYPTPHSVYKTSVRDDDDDDGDAK